MNRYVTKASDYRPIFRAPSQNRGGAGGAGGGGGGGVGGVVVL